MIPNNFGKIEGIEHSFFPLTSPPCFAEEGDTRDSVVDGQEVHIFNSDSPSAIATRITWKGYEFLDEARDKNRWKEAVRIAQEKGGGAVSIGILTQILSALAKQSLGLN